MSEIGVDDGLVPLCRLDELADPGARGFEIERAEQRIHLFVVRNGSRAYAYLNICPHAGTPLDWSPNQFLSPDRARIQCSTHGARFLIASGRCDFGRCLGRSLDRLPVTLRDGWVCVTPPDG